MLLLYEVYEILAENNLNSNLSYSTDEQICGTWIDGKPIYRKVITGTSITGNTDFNVSHGISNIDTVVNANIYAYDHKSSTTARWRQLNFVYANDSGSNNAWYGGFAITDQNIIFQVGSSFARNTTKWHAIIEYTKTAD